MSVLAAPRGANSGVLHLRQGQNHLGQVVLDLDHLRAPRIVANFIGLATGEFAWVDPVTKQLQQNRPFYNGVIFHRLIHNFMIQGGDRTGTGTQGPGYLFQDQFHNDLGHVQYAVSMAHSGPNTNGSQFFITLVATPHLDDYHSVFGLVIDPASRTLLQQFTNPLSFPTGAQDRPLTDIVIDSVTIEGWDPETFDIHDPALEIPHVKPVHSRLVFQVDGNGVRQPFLEWDARDLHQYPFAETGNLLNWTGASRYVYTMGGDGIHRSPVTAPVAGQTRFASTFAVDYSMIPLPPQNVFAPGSSLRLHVSGGDYTFAFTAPDAQGYVGSWWTTGNPPAPILLTDTGASFTGYAGTLELFPKDATEERVSDQDFRLLRLRSIVIQISENDFVFGTLSFHSATQGWYVWGENNSNRVPFTWTPAEE